MKKIWYWKIFMALFCLIAAGVTVRQAEAAEVKSVPIKLQTDVKSYDVTGDGKKDVIRVQSEKPVKSDGYTEGPWVIMINGKVAYRSNPKNYTEYLTVCLYQVDSRRIYLSIADEVGSNDDINECAFYQYQDSKLKKVCDIFSPMVRHKSLLHIYIEKVKVTKKKIQVKYVNQFSVTGYLRWTAVFHYTDGKWKLDGNTYPTKKKNLTANRKIKLRKKPGGTEQSVVLKKGQKVQATAICLKNKKAYIKFVLPDGRKGWMKSGARYDRQEYYFKDVIYAG